MKLDELVGNINVDPSHLQAFVKAWYLPQDVIAIVGIPPTRQRRGVLSTPVVAKDLLTWTVEDIEGMSIRASTGEKYGTYVTLFPIKDPAKVNIMGKRGDETNTGDVYGVFVDLDVKDGCFSSKEEILTFLSSGEVPRPTIVIDNGQTGGMHAYWRLNWDEVGYKDLLSMWHAFMSKAAGDRKIDRLIDLTRVSRMPSGVYWPKEGSEGIADTVKVIWTDGPRYSLQELEEFSKEAWDNRVQRIKQTWKDHTTRRLDANEIAAAYLNTDLVGWKLYSAIASVEEMFQEHWSWADILVPAGWTYVKTDSQGREEWGRPGRMEKSATVNWPESPDMMSLLSESEETGLSDLKEAGIALTKYQVALRLLWHDDIEKMTIDVINTVGVQS